MLQQSISLITNPSHDNARLAILHLINNPQILYTTFPVCDFPDIPNDSFQDLVLTRGAGYLLQHRSDILSNDLSLFSEQLGIPIESLNHLTYFPVESEDLDQPPHIDKAVGEKFVITLAKRGSAGPIIWESTKHREAEYYQLVRALADDKCGDKQLIADSLRSYFNLKQINHSIGLVFRALNREDPRNPTWNPLPHKPPKITEEREVYQAWAGAPGAGI